MDDDIPAWLTGPLDPPEIYRLDLAAPIALYHRLDRLALAAGLSVEALAIALLEEAAERAECAATVEGKGAADGA